MWGVQGLRFVFDLCFFVVCCFNVEDYFGGFCVFGIQQVGEVYNFVWVDLQVKWGDGFFFIVVFKCCYWFIVQQGMVCLLQGIVVQFVIQYYFYQFNLWQFVGFVVVDEVVVMQYGDVVVDCIDLVEKMGDEDQVDVVIFELVYQGEQYFYFLGIEVGGGFVEDQYFG